MSLVIYVIGERRTGVVKIGTASNPLARLADLQVANPNRLRLWGAFDGERSVETALHKRFSDLRIHGEWFDFGDFDAVVAVAKATAELLIATSDARPSESLMETRALQTLMEVRDVFEETGALEMTSVDILARLENLPGDRWSSVETRQRACMMLLSSDLRSAASELGFILDRGSCKVSSGVGGRFVSGYKLHMIEPLVKAATRSNNPT